MARSSTIVDPRNLHVRPGEPADSPALRQIFLRARSLSWTWLPAAAWRLEDFDAATADEQLWVAECDGQPVGFAAVWTADNFLHHLFVDPDWQGKTYRQRAAGAGRTDLYRQRNAEVPDGK